MWLWGLSAFGAPTVAVSVDLGHERHDRQSAAVFGAAASHRWNNVISVEADVWGRVRPTGDRVVPRERLLVSDGIARRAGGAGFVVFSPLSGELASAPLAIDFGVGLGVLATRDDLEALQCAGEVSCESTRNGVHPSMVWTTGPRIELSEQLSLRVRLRGEHWIDVLEGVNLVRQGRVSATAGLTFGFGRRVAI